MDGWANQGIVLDKPETLFENTLHTLHSLVTMALGKLVTGRARASDVSYSEIKQSAGGLGPVWTDDGRRVRRRPKRVG